MRLLQLVGCDLLLRGQVAQTGIPVIILLMTRVGRPARTTMVRLPASGRLLCLHGGLFTGPIIHTNRLLVGRLAWMCRADNMHRAQSSLGWRRTLRLVLHRRGLRSVLFRLMISGTTSAKFLAQN